MGVTAAPPCSAPSPVQRCVHEKAFVGAPGRSCGTAPRRWHRGHALLTLGSGILECPQ